MKNKGFTLVEVLIAMVISSIIVLAVAKLQIQITRDTAVSTSMNEASSIAANSITENANIFATLEVKENSKTVAGTSVEFTVVNTITAIDEQLMKIESVVTWEQYARNYRTVLSTIEPKVFRSHQFFPSIPLPDMISCIDADKGHGNDFWGVDLDNPGKANKVPTVGEEVTCE